MFNAAQAAVNIEHDSRPSGEFSEGQRERSGAGMGNLAKASGRGLPREGGVREVGSERSKSNSHGCHTRQKFSARPRHPAIREDFHIGKSLVINPTKIFDKNSVREAPSAPPGPTHILYVDFPPQNLPMVFYVKVWPHYSKNDSNIGNY